MMQLSQLPLTLNKNLEYLELDAWDEGMYGAKSYDHFQIDLDNRIFDVFVKVNIKSRPKKSFRAKVTIEPYEESIAKVMIAFFKPTITDAHNLVKERNSNFILFVNEEEK